MAKWGKTDLKELKRLEEKLTKLEEADFDRAARNAANQIAQIMLNKVKKRTPVGVPPEVDAEIFEQYWSGYKGGTLRRAWTILPIEKQGNNYVVTVINNMEYASYVEYGHRQLPGRYVPALGKSLKAAWVEGRRMMTFSIQEVERLTPALLEKAVLKALKEVF